MGWVSDFTKNWGLKTSFFAYMVASLIFSVPLSLICQSIFMEVRKNYILNKVLSTSHNFLDKIMLSALVERFIDFIPIIVIIVFFYIFFNLFYKDKIQSILEFLDRYDEIDLGERNELSDKVFALITENKKLRKENFIKKEISMTSIKKWI